LEEFAKHGYNSASTNRIVEKAEISKGILFHYFKNKKGLYFYLLRHTIDILTQKYEAVAPTFDREVFAKIQQMTIFKLELIEQFPIEHDLMTKAMQETNEDIQAEVASIIAETTGRAMVMLFQDMDISKFRPGVDIQKAIEVITWTLEGFSKKYVAEQTDAAGNILIDRDKLFQGMNEYVDLLKLGLYQ
jgi:AcrR family transcriptional regulator